MKASPLILRFFVLSLCMGILWPVPIASSDPSLSKGIGATSCFDVISWQHHASAKKDITNWVENFVKEVNVSLIKNHLDTNAPKVSLERDLLWFGTLAYCALDTKKTLVEAVMDLILNEWEKLKEGN